MSVSWSSYNITLLSRTGIEVMQLDTFATLQMTRTVNNVGALAMTMPYTDGLWAALQKDAWIDVWRADSSGICRRVMGALWIVTGRRLELVASGSIMINITAADQLEILRRYIVAFDSNGLINAVPGSNKVGSAEGIIKGYVSDNLIIANSSLSRPGLSQYVSVEPYVSASYTISSCSPNVATISAVTVGSPTVLTVGVNIPSGETVNIVASGTTPSISGTYTATNFSSTQISIPVHVTSVGTITGTVAYDAVVTCNGNVPTGTQVTITGSNTTPSMNGQWTATNVSSTQFSIPAPVRSGGSTVGTVTIDSGRGYIPSAMAAAWQNLLSVCTQVARASTQYLSYLAFDLEVQSTSPLSFLFRCYAGQRGTNRAIGSTMPLTLSDSGGAFGAATYSEDYSSSVSFVICGGQTAAGETATGTAVDPVLDVVGPFAHSEAYVAQQMSVDPDTLQTQARDALRLNRPVLDVQNVTIVQSPSLVYGRDFEFGDLVTVRVRSVTVAARLESLTLGYDAASGLETISGSLRSEYSP
jgi:hypothetical protein